MLKSKKGKILICIIIVFLLCICVYLINMFISYKSNSVDNTIIYNSNNITSNTTYSDENNNIDTNFIIEETTNRKYINNEISIYFYKSIEDSKCEEIIKEIGGTISNSSSLTKRYDIKLNNVAFSTYDEITNYCDHLEKQYEEIEAVHLNEYIEDPFYGEEYGVN